MIVDDAASAEPPGGVRLTRLYQAAWSGTDSSVLASQGGWPLYNKHIYYAVTVNLQALPFQPSDKSLALPLLSKISQFQSF